MEEIKLKPLLIGLFILLGSVGTTYYIAQGDKAYSCEDTGTVGICFKLSAINADGAQTRCYYNEAEPTKYKYCRTGWLPYEAKTVTGDPTEIPTHIEYGSYNLTNVFNDKIEAEDYIVDLKSNTKSEVKVTGIRQKPFSSSLEVLWQVIFYDEREEDREVCNETTGECDTITFIIRDIIHQEELSSMVQEGLTNAEINTIVEKHAYDYVNQWSPNVIVEYR